MKRFILLAGICIISGLQANAQGWLEKMGKKVKEKTVENVEERIEQNTENAIDKELDKAEKAVKQSDDRDNSDSSDTNEGKASNGAKQTKLEGTSQYDFVPGNKILYFEDFSQDAIGDFPAQWTSNGSGEVKTVNIAPGRWLHLNGEDAVYCYMKEIEFPDNFIIEFDLIPDNQFDYGIELTLYQEDKSDPKELNDNLYPGIGGIQIVPKKDGWETKGYHTDKDWLTGNASRNPIIQEELNHVIVWIQKRRVRIYHQGAKVLDAPTNIYPETKFDRLRFSGWDRHSSPYVSNLKITTAASDTRSKLITEGKLVTYGITFDVNKADIKPESYGTLKSIADVLKENPDIKIKIEGHTDSDGDAAANLELSKLRADAVKKQLSTGFGIETARMQTAGAGENIPISPNDTPANKATNRRVEITKL